MRKKVHQEMPESVTSPTAVSRGGHARIRIIIENDRKPTDEVHQQSCGGKVTAAWLKPRRKPPHASQIVELHVEMRLEHVLDSLVRGYSRHLRRFAVYWALDSIQQPPPTAYDPVHSLFLPNPV
jgi:hypothetical protein